MAEYTYTYTAAQLQAHHDRISAVTGDLIGSDNLGEYAVIESRFKGDQNFNVLGNTGHPLPGPIGALYPVGAQVTASRTVVGANLENARRYDNGSGVLLFDADSGSTVMKYQGNFTSDYFALVLEDGTHYTGAGLSAVLIGGNTEITIDHGVVPPYKFEGFSQNAGQYVDVSDDESERAYRGGYLLVTNASGSAYIYADGTIKQVIPPTIIGSGVGVRTAIAYPIPFTADLTLSHQVQGYDTPGTVVGSVNASADLADREDLNTLYVIGIGSSITKIVSATVWGYPNA